MKLTTAVRRLREHVGQNTYEFGKALGVSHVAVLHWERGEGIGAWSRVKLLDLAKRSDAPADLVEVFEAAQPEVRP